jgi:hypothetical protein
VGSLFYANIQYRTVEILLDGLINVSRQGAFSNSYVLRGHSVTSQYHNHSQSLKIVAMVIIHPVTAMG